MASNSKQSKLSEKGDECTFTWKVYTSWDFGIANVETAHNKVNTSWDFGIAIVETAHNKVNTSWDFGIANVETAHNEVNSNVITCPCHQG